MSNHQPVLLDILDLAELLQCSRATILRRWAAGVIPQPVRIVGHVRWRADDVKSWLSSLPTAPAPKHLMTKPAKPVEKERR